MKTTFQQKRAELDVLLGENPQEYLCAQTSLVDDVVISSYKKIMEEIDGDHFAILALGGYGRSELYPYSDVDLFVLYRDEGQEAIGRFTDAILYPLWDRGLDVGHSVRTVDDAMADAGEDYIFRVSLLDARFLCGSEALFAELTDLYKKKYIEGARKEFVEEMKARRQQRCDRFGSHSYLLEPHIKEGRGGMRDVQAMFWTARVVFGLFTLAHIEEAGFLLPAERESFERSYGYLIQVRLYLHRLSGRKNDQLYFEQQQELAELLGYKDGDGLLAVELFMRDLYQHLHTVAYVTDLFFHHLDEALGLVLKNLKVPDKDVEKGIEIRGGSVHMTADAAQLNAKPHTLVRVFLIAAKNGLDVYYRSQKLIAQNVHLINDKVRQSPRLTKPFLAILAEAKDVFGILESMLESGLLSACIPEMGRIESLAQHDLYHIYTVDRHSLQTVMELRACVEDWSSVATNVDNLHLLYLVGLLHDIGKGSGRDHSEEGAELIRGVGARFGFSDEEIEDLSFVVRYHLFIPESALRRDLSDSAFINRCATMIGSTSRLAMLYLLAVADSKATGPSAWSDWKASLMYEMYLKVHSAIEYIGSGQALVIDDEGQGADWLRGQVAQNVTAAGLEFDLAKLPDDYITHFSPDEVLSHIGLYHENYRLLRQKPFVRVYRDDEGWKVLFMSMDSPGVLAKVCGVLALHNLAVVKAQIFTWKDGTVVDVVSVRSLDGAGFNDKDWNAMSTDIDLAFSHRLNVGVKLYQKQASAYGRRIELEGNIEPRVVVDNISSDTYTVIEVYAADKPHILYWLTQTLADLKVNIYKAYIATEVEQLIDVFYVLNSEGEKLLSEVEQENVKKNLLVFLKK